MKENKTVRINVRLTEDQRGRWHAASREMGYKNLSVLVEDAVEEKIERGQEAQHAQTPPTIAATATQEGAPVESPFLAEPRAASFESYPVVTAVTENTITVERGFKPDPKKSSKGVCSNEGKHRKGIYCKQCRKVVR